MTRGEALSTASRVRTWLMVGAAPWPGSCGCTPPCAAGAPGCATWPGWPGVWTCCCCCCALICASCFCFSICGRPTKYCQAISTSADRTMARMVFFWSVITGVLPCARMWGGGRLHTSGMHAGERAAEILDQALERQMQRRAPADQHIVASRPHRRLSRQPHHFAQPPADAIALGRIADLLGDGKSH